MPNYINLATVSLTQTMQKSCKLILSLFSIFACIVACFLLAQLSANESLKEALFYKQLEGKTVQCQLCPRRCIIADGQRGYCRVRENKSGILYTLVYAKPVAIHIDPIEKKPLFHFLPSTSAFSVGTAGCNLRCKFCQNWEISQAKPEDLRYTYIEPKELVEKAIESHALTIAYTYNEPTIFYEYMLETAKFAKEAGLKNVMHSSGYINEGPLRILAGYLDAANIDLKGFSEEYYSRLSEGSLEPVLKSLKVLKEEGVHLEITNLILPGYNDDQDTITKMCLWIKENLGSDTPLHFSRFFPMYKLTNLNPTPLTTLERARQIALDCGLKYVYIGNIGGHPAENTYCPKCKKILIERKGYFVLQNNIENDKCKFCGEKIEGVWH
jgi:pyruvate formate lyase activating enzyme